MFIKKKRHFIEFAIILAITCIFAYLLVKIIGLIHLPSSELELDHNQNIEKILLEDN